MPTLLEIILDPVSLIVLALFAGWMIWEGLAPGRTLPVFHALFNILRNPRDFEVETGFNPGASEPSQTC